MNIIWLVTILAFFINSWVVGSNAVKMFFGCEHAKMWRETPQFHKNDYETTFAKVLIPARMKRRHLDGPQELDQIQELSNFTIPKFTTRNMYSLHVRPEGSTLRLKCRADGNPRPLITWFKDDAVPKARDFGIIRYHKFSMIMEDLLISDSGKYTCVVCNIVGCINNTYVVEVIGRIHTKPLIVGDLSRNTTIMVHDTAKLNCTILASESTFITWYKENIKLGSQDEVLIIKNVTHCDEGWYTCYADNFLGESIAKGYLKIIDGPIQNNTMKSALS